MAANRLLVLCSVAPPVGQHLGVWDSPACGRIRVSKAFTEGKAAFAGISLRTDGGPLVEFQRRQIFFKDSRS